MKTGKILLSILSACLFLVACNNSGSEGKDSPQGTVYFLVTEVPGLKYHGDSYVVGISDPTDIAYARSLIANQGVDQGRGNIIVARIAAGADGVNRDMLSEPVNNWSWHITAFESFSGSTIEILDGWPSFIESDVEGWMENTQGRVGFWSYTITQELSLP